MNIVVKIPLKKYIVVKFPPYAINIDIVNSGVARILSQRVQTFEL